MSELSDEIQLEFTRQYLEEMDKTFLGRDRVVTLDDAREFQNRMSESKRFEQMMLTFIGDVMTSEKNGNLVEMNKEHLNWIRWYHQKNQRAGLYKGSKFGRPPELLGMPIYIVNNLDEPKLINSKWRRY